MSFNLYTEKSALEEIIIDDTKYPIWNEILKQNIDILLNTSDEELNTDINDPESIIFHLLQGSASAKIPIALSSYFEVLKNNPSESVNKPHSAFILDITHDEAKTIQKSFGVAVFSSEKINNDFVTGGFLKDLNKNENFPGGYQSLIPNITPTSNAFVITDSYLFANTERTKNYGVENLINLIDAFIPSDLSIDYHITVITENPKPALSREKWNQLAGSLKARISQLRSYPINFELIITNTIHPRRLLSNHISCVTDKGFDLFKVVENETIRQDNSISMYSIFNNVHDFGDNHMDTLNKELHKLKTILQSTVSYVQKNKQDNTRIILGDCHTDKEIKNRLLN